MNVDFSVDFSKGLVPAVVQHADDRRVLMVGYMNEEALRTTLETREVVFFSRSKNRLWKKGETSGNVLDLAGIDVDCDGDTLLVQAWPRGPTCHTGAETCFGAQRLGALEALDRTIRERQRAPGEGSYTASLLAAGMARIAQKVGEEAVELAIAAQHENQKRCVEESADLLYHLLVLLAGRGISLEEVYRELEARRK